MRRSVLSTHLPIRELLRKWRFESRAPDEPGVSRGRSCRGYPGKLRFRLRSAAIAAGNPGKWAFCSGALGLGMKQHPRRAELVPEHRKPRREERLLHRHAPARVPQANTFCEHLIGTIRRECLDFVIPITDRHLRAILREWIRHYNRGHTRVRVPAFPNARSTTRSAIQEASGWRPLSSRGDGHPQRPTSRASVSTKRPRERRVNDICGSQVAA